LPSKEKKKKEKKEKKEDGHKEIPSLTDYSVSLRACKKQKQKQKTRNKMMYDLAVEILRTR
jgi:hypothetical protein